MARAHGGWLRHLPQGRDPAEHLRASLAELRRRYRDIGLEDRSRAWNTEWLLSDRARLPADVAQAMAHARSSAANRAAPRSGSMASRARRCRVPQAFARPLSGRWPARHRLRAGEDHPLAARPARLGRLAKPEPRRMRPMPEAAIAEDRRDPDPALSARSVT